MSLPCIRNCIPAARKLGPMAAEEALEFPASQALRTTLQFHQLSSSTKTVLADSSSFQSHGLSVRATLAVACFRSRVL